MSASESGSETETSMEEKPESETEQGSEEEEEEEEDDRKFAMDESVTHGPIVAYTEHSKKIIKIFKFNFQILLMLNNPKAPCNPKKKRLPKRRRRKKKKMMKKTPSPRNRKFDLHGRNQPSRPCRSQDRLFRKSHPWDQRPKRPRRQQRTRVIIHHI